MVNPSELRIGNWVYQTLTGPPVAERVVSADPDGARLAYSGDALSQYLEPIPLTPELLEKAGFTKDEEGDGYQLEWGESWGARLVYVPSRSGWAASFGPTPRQHRSNCAIIVQYVHQLQNYFFAVSEGLELEINL